MSKKVKTAILDNPVLILFLGSCPALGATSSLTGAFGMGIAALLVMLLSAAVISAVKKLIPECARIAAYVIIIAGFVSIVQMLMQAFLPEIYKMMGIYLTVAAVNLLFFANCEKAEASSFGKAMVESVKTGVFFIIALAVTGAVRETFGSATLAGKEIAFLAEYKIPLLLQASGGFAVYSFVAAIVAKIFGNNKPEGADTACKAAGLCCCKKEEV